MFNRTQMFLLQRPVFTNPMIKLKLVPLRKKELIGTARINKRKVDASLTSKVVKMISH
jgi:hypothetical protein